ncbi:TPA: hypothetical protein QDE50_31020 [Burkholderia cenocepacia]|nr:hypothetical protein [Burkholderia cenocepacia]
MRHMPRPAGRPGSPCGVPGAGCRVPGAGCQEPRAGCREFDSRTARPRSCAKCRYSLRKRRIARCISPDASVQAAAPCQNSRSSSRRSGAPSFSFLRSQELPCRHCSGLV